jgi:hypothetical protein
MKRLTDEEILNITDGICGCGMTSIKKHTGKYQTVAQTQLDADLEDLQKERERIIKEIEKLSNLFCLLVNIRYDTCLDDSKDCDTLKWQSLKQRIREGLK